MSIFLLIDRQIIFLEMVLNVSKIYFVYGENISLSHYNPYKYVIWLYDFESKEVITIALLVYGPSFILR